jgi:spore coat protein U-like protein
MFSITAKRNAMRNTFNIAVVLAAVAALLPPQLKAAGTISGEVKAQITLQAGCIITGAPGGPLTGANFGTLDFGIQPAAFTGVLTATPSGGAGGSGQTQIQCSPDVAAITIGVNGGSYASEGSGIGVGARAMKLDTSTSYLPYEVYSDVGMTTAYPANGAAVGYTLPASGQAATLPIYGRVNKTSTLALPAGAYTDTLMVTITW